MGRYVELDIDRLRDALLAEVEAHLGGAPHSDDITLLILEIP